MSEKINIAELLKDCPSGMELYSPIFGKVYLDKIKPHLAIIVATDKYKEEFLYDGRYGMNGECMLFPSKDKTTWEGFVPLIEFKDGDVVATTDGLWIGITTGGEKGQFIPAYCVIYHGSEFEAYLDNKETWVFNRLATEEEKQKLFQAIKDNGYKWNEKTKTLEKFITPKFKMGDIVQNKNTNMIGTISSIDYADCDYTVNLKCDAITYILFEFQDEWVLVKDTIEPKFKVGDKIKYKNGKNIDGVEQGVILSITDEVYDVAVTNNMGVYVSIAEQNNWELVSNKFDISSLKLFDKVLVRHNKENIWCGSFFSHIDDNFHSHCYKYVTITGKSYPMCIPYEGNEHLFNTNNDCDTFYKNW